MDTVVVIKKLDPNSYVGGETFKAVAANEGAALRWIQDEVDGVFLAPGQRKSYMDGKTAQEWIDMGYFKLETLGVFE